MNAVISVANERGNERPTVGLCNVYTICLKIPKQELTSCVICEFIHVVQDYICSDVADRRQCQSRVNGICQQTLALDKPGWRRLLSTAWVDTLMMMR